MNVLFGLIAFNRGCLDFVQVKDHGVAPPQGSFDPTPPL
jgi:hypothetical protein